MPCTRSSALTRWLGERRQSIDGLAAAHQRVSAAGRAGRPLDAGRPLAHAYVVQVCAQFQGFVRDLHDVAIDAVVTAAAPPDLGLRQLLLDGLTAGRAADRGNADANAIVQDMKRVGLRYLRRELTAVQPRWASGGGHRGDAAVLGDLLALRNCLAHGNERRRSELRAAGVLDTVSYARATLVSLNRTSRALDRVVWDHLQKETGAAPWQRR